MDVGPDRIGGVIFGMWYRKGFKSRLAKPKTIKLSFADSPLSTQLRE